MKLPWDQYFVNFRNACIGVGALAVPAAAAYWQYKSAAETVREQYVAMAVGLLQKPTPEKKDASDSDLRKWAVDVINASAPVKLSDSLQKRLTDGEVHWTDFDSLILRHTPIPLLYPEQPQPKQGTRTGRGGTCSTGRASSPNSASYRAARRHLELTKQEVSVYGVCSLRQP